MKVGRACRRICIAAVLCAPLPVFAQGENSLLIELMDDMENLHQEVRELRNKNDELERELKALKSDYQKHARSHSAQQLSMPRDEMSDESQKRVVSEAAAARPSTAGRTTATDEKEATDNKTRTATPAPHFDEQLSDDEVTTYYAALERPDNQSLRRDMNGFLKRYPDSALAPGAHYWIAESHYDDGSHQQAARHYDIVINRYKDSDNYNDARLKRAYIHYEKEEWDKARALLTALASLKDDKYSPLAKSRLESMDKEGL